MTISIAKAKSLCNPNELSLITVSMPKEIGKLSGARLRQKVTRARELRDKWRDQAERQRRTEQQRQGARQTSAAKRSAEKAQLFDEALSRFEKQLAKNPDGEGTVGAKKSTPKMTRTKQHRAARAAVRDQLEETRHTLSAGRKAEMTKGAAKDEAQAKQPESRADESQAAETKATAEMKGAGKSAPSSRAVRSLAPKGLTELAAAQGLRTNKKKQHGAQAAAKSDRLKKSASTRIQKHLSARTKRAQAKRDAR
jgi:hypothetical protein